MSRGAVDAARRTRRAAAEAEWLEAEILDAFLRCPAYLERVLWEQGVRCDDCYLPILARETLDTPNDARPPGLHLEPCVACGSETCTYLVPGPRPPSPSVETLSAAIPPNIRRRVARHLART